MTEYYFDIETTGTDLEKDRIITIQFQELDSKTGKAIGDLTILKAWESSEEQISKAFLKIFQPDYPWNFIPIGTNLSFDFFILNKRWKQYNINVSLKTLLYNHPYLDIRPILILANGGKFKEATLENLGYKNHAGSDIPVWYAAKDYEAIEKYIIEEAKGFIDFYQLMKDVIMGFK